MADSTRTLRVELPGAEPLLFFPVSDIHLDLIGEADRDILVEPEPGHELDGMKAFDHDRVRVELVDRAGADAERDVTIKRFPTWGDAADLIELLDVQRMGERSYGGGARADLRRHVVEGSQMLAQAIVASCRHTGRRRVVSAHMVFARPADPEKPLAFELEEVSAGRSFTVLSVRVNQDDRCRAVGTLLMDETAQDVVLHSADPPDVPNPYSCDPYDMSVTGRDVRVAEGAYTDDPDAAAGQAVIDAWVRFREVPGEPCVHAGLLAQFTGHMSIAAALRPHQGIGQAEAHRGLSTAINAIYISFHADVRADRWMLYHHRSTFAGRGMTHSECTVHDEDGNLLASFYVDAMVRRFAIDVEGLDERSTL